MSDLNARTVNLFTSDPRDLAALSPDERPEALTEPVQLLLSPTDAAAVDFLLIAEEYGDEGSDSRECAWVLDQATVTAYCVSLDGDGGLNAACSPEITNETRRHYGMPLLPTRPRA